MKKAIATAVLALVASQANADGFYQQVVGNSPQSGQEISPAATKFTYTPLYLRVVDESRQALDRGQTIKSTATRMTYTPLYLKVIGQAG